MCQGWLEGYLLTGRHGFFSCYEAFIHIIDSMFNQHAKWLKVTRGIPWRRPIASLNYLLTSHVWRQDHNGFSHQDPGFIDHVVNKKADVVRVYLPPDANSLLSVADHCLRSRNYVNVIVAGKQPALQWLDMDAAIEHCTAGHRHLGVGQQRSGRRARRGDGLLRRCPHARNAGRRGSAAQAYSGSENSRRQRGGPDDACSPRASIRTACPIAISIRFSPPTSPSSSRSTAIPWLIHRLTYRRTNHDNLHVRGYKEEGTTTTPFDMTVLNDLDRFHLAGDVIDRVPRPAQTSPAIQAGAAQPADRAQALHRALRQTTCRRSATGSGRPHEDPGPERRIQQLEVLVSGHSPDGPHAGPRALNGARIGWRRRRPILSLVIAIRAGRAE